MTQEELTAPMVCSKCGADKVAKSHSRNRDRLIMQFLPKRPYRCLHCYHRFWKPEPFFASQSRVISWLGVVAVIIGAVFLPNWTTIKRDKPEPFSDFGSAPNAVPGQPPAELLESGDSAQTALVDNNASASAEPSSDVNDGEETDLFAESISSQALDSLPPIQADTAASELVDQKAGNEISNPATVLEELYTTEQLQQRLSLAKATAEQAEQVNLHQQARLQQSMANDPGELQSLLKVDINFRIDQWRKAWEVGFVDDYLSFYSEQFLPANGLTREQWVAQRKQRIRPTKKIDLTLDNFNVVFSDDNSVSTVSFDQVYQSGLYVEASRKKLVLHKEQQEWKIVSETEVAQEAPQ